VVEENAGEEGNEDVNEEEEEEDVVIETDEGDDHSTSKLWIQTHLN
jgi:hypothetical protein